MLSSTITLHRKFERNQRGRDFFVGDIHGEYDLLLFQLKVAGFNEKYDRLFALGDLINHGPDSVNCLMLLKADWFFSVKGNHEEMLLSLIDDPSAVNRLDRVGGGWVHEVPSTKLRYLMALIYTKMAFSFTVETHLGNVGLVHAQAPISWQNLIDENITEQEKGEMLWSLERHKSTDNLNVEGIDVCLHGHANCQNIVKSKNQIWIDTIKRTGKLSILTTEQVFSLLGEMAHDLR